MIDTLSLVIKLLPDCFMSFCYLWKQSHDWIVQSIIDVKTSRLQFAGILFWKESMALCPKLHHMRVYKKKFQYLPRSIFDNWQKNLATGNWRWVCLDNSFLSNFILACIISLHPSNFLLHWMWLKNSAFFSSGSVVLMKKNHQWRIIH